MGRTVTEDPEATLAAAKDRIATAALAGDQRVDIHLGRLTLRPHQRTAVARLLEILARYRGALLADAVGLGKTYVALAIASRYERPLIVCPAALRSMWGRALAVASLDYPVIGLELLARGARPPFEPDLVIVDEAHHFRNPATRRYETVAHLAHRARVLLLSATPLHNSRRDLTSILALFLGSAVQRWDDRDVARLIVRRDEHSAGESLPALDGPHSLSPGADDDCLDAIMALPVAVPAADEGTAGALAAISLLHLWSSSRAALVASLRKRRARALALRDAIGSGHLPTASELAAWHFADESLQLAFPFCVPSGGPSVDVDELQRRLDAYVAAVAALIAQCRVPPDPDGARVALLRMLRSRHEGVRVVAFSQYAQTVIALGRLMRADRGVAVVTGENARIASGPIRREEVLAQFAGGAGAVPPAERIDLLLSTDLLSEGVDLRGAAVVVHLDLPWNPARLTQRVGRARRLGSPHDVVHLYTFVPPTAAERMLTLEKRLASKMRIADAVVGGASAPTPFITPPASPVAAAESLRVKLADWLNPGVRPESRLPVIAAARAPRTGWVAVVRLDGLPRLVYSIDGSIRDDAETFLTLARSLTDAVHADPVAVETVRSEVRTWLDSRMAIAGLGATEPWPSSKRAVLDRLALSIARAPRHRRPALLAAAQRARAAVTSVSGVGAERVLDELAKSPADDDAWIHSVEAFSRIQPPADPTTGDRLDVPGIEALILLTPEAHEFVIARAARATH